MLCSSLECRVEFQFSEVTLEALPFRHLDSIKSGEVAKVDLFKFTDCPNCLKGKFSCRCLNQDFSFFITKLTLNFDAGRGGYSNMLFLPPF